MRRRGFLLLCASAVPGLWLAGRGPVRLSRAMVLKLGGACPFCRKEAHEVVGLAGVTGLDARICNECLDLCCDILAEEQGWRDLGKKPPARASDLAALPPSEVGPWLSRHYGVPFVDVSELTVPANLLEKLPSHVIHDFGVLPIDRTRRVLRIAMADPSNTTLSRSIAQQLRMEVDVVVSTLEAIRRAHARALSNPFDHRLVEAVRDAIDKHPELEASARGMFPGWDRSETIGEDELQALLTTSREASAPKPKPKSARRPRATPNLACSFCEKSLRDVLKLIAGPGDYICDGCVGDALALFIQHGKM